MSSVVARTRLRTLRRAALLLAGLVLLIGLVAPLRRVDRFAAPVRAALERSLDRKVEVNGPVRLHLFPAPRISLENVIIHEDPAVSAEPFAYVSSLEAGFRLASLVRGRLAFSGLRLVRPSVNLVKRTDGPWNYPPLFDRAFGSSGPRDWPFQRIEIRSGRLNFKFGDTKSVFYLADADVDVAPAADAGVVTVRFRGKPARTDRAAQGFGRISGTGRVTFSRAQENQVHLVVRLERSAIAELLTLVQGRRVGVGGFIASRAELNGPVSDVAITGSLELVDIDQRFLFPSRTGAWSLDYRGRLNLTGQALELATRSEGQQRPVGVRFQILNYLRQPRWAVAVTADRLPLETLPELAREMGVEALRGLTVHGTASGALSWGPQQGARGQLAMRDLAVGTDGAGEVRCPEATLTLGRDVLRLSPATVLLERKDRVRVAAEYAIPARRLDVRAEASLASIPRFLAAWRSLTGASPAPLLETMSAGAWSGWLRYARQGRGQGTWSADLTLKGARTLVAGFSEPLDLTSAHLRLAAGQWSLETLRGRIGNIRFQGSCDYDARTPRLHQFHITVPKADVLELERVLMPTLAWARRGFLARTLRLRPAPLPGWLKTRRARGTVQIRELDAGAVRFEGLQAQLRWNGTDIEIAPLKSNFEAGAVEGRVAVDLGEGAPRYVAEAHLTGLAYAGGVFTVDGRLHTTGMGAAVVRNARAEGKFSVRGLRVAPDDVLSHVRGSFSLVMSRGIPRLTFPEVEFTRRGTVYRGRGETTLTGKAVLDVKAGADAFRMEGTLVPLRLALKPSRASTLE